MPKMTKAEWLAAVDECGGDLSQDALINLVFKDGPNALWTDVANQMHQGQLYSMYRYLTSLFPHRVWADWQGITELGQQYHNAYMPFDLSQFQRSMQVCSPDSMNECHTDYCEIPSGGISAIPELEMYKWGYKTQPMCIANIRTSMRAKQMALNIVNERFQVDSNVMNTFYIMALIRMLGHKWTLELDKDPTTGELIPFASSNPRNMLGGYRYSYGNPLFPTVSNVQNIGALDIHLLDQLGRMLTESRNPNGTGTGPRGEPIFELWHGADWYRQEIIDNAEWIERTKYTMPEKILAGYTLEPGQKEIVGNFSMKVMPNLPRFAESTEGGLTVVQPMQTVDVDAGKQAIHNYVEWSNAPFLMTVALGKNIGEILTRPAISTGIEGREIMPITGNGDWTYRNDYDKECNEDLNKPHFRKRYEMGFRALNLDSGWGFISRAKKFRARPITTCDLRPVFAINPGKTACDSILTVGCNPTNDKVSNNILTGTTARRVACGATMCGKSTIWRVSIRKENQDSISPNQSPIGPCACGDNIQVFIGDADGDTAKQATATIIEILRPNIINPQWSMLIELEAALGANECIQYVSCRDETINLATVIHCVDSEASEDIAAGTIKFILDSALPCVAGSTVTIEYFDKDGVSLGTVEGEIESFNVDQFSYLVSSLEADFLCKMYDDQCTVKISCDDPVYTA